MDLGISQATLAEARRRYAAKFFPKDITDPKFADMVTEVVERFHTDGFWVGSKSTFTMAISATGHVTLPIFLESIIDARIDETPRPVKTQRYQFLYDGPGEIDVESSTLGVLSDAGRVATEVEFPSTAGQIKLTITNSNDAGKKVRLLGYDASGDEIRGTGSQSGELVTLADPNATSSATFSAIRGIQKPELQGRLIVSHVGVSDTELADIPSFVTTPVYRRYLVPAVDCDNVIAYCKRRALPVRAEEDYILPGNLSALKQGLYGLNFEEKSDPDRAQYYWGLAKSILNDEATEYRGGATEPAPVKIWGEGISKVRGMR